MFTGIVSHLGRLKAVENSRYSFAVPASFCKKLKKGSSVAVNGACLTLVSSPEVSSFSVELMPETLKKTMLGTLTIGDEVNLELPMSPNNLFEGHIVQGHVDGVGKLSSIVGEGNSQIITVTTESDLMRYIIDKGSIAVNGISLTVIKAMEDAFTVGIIPHTWKHTMLHTAKVGDSVNLEVDVLAKYMEKLMRKKQ